MGLGKSKFPISYEEACRRAGNDVVERLKDTFDKYASNTGVLPRVTFLKDIFGDGMPPQLAENLYDAFNGGQKGIKFSDLLRGLVVLVHGTRDEKITFLAHMFSEEGLVRKEELQKFLAAVDVDPTPVDLDALFYQESWVVSSEFAEWLKKNPNLSSVTEWLLEDGESSSDKEAVFSFTAPPDPPTFYQMLADKFKVEQQDVMDIEKAYWGLKGNNGKFDESVLQSIISPPLPEAFCASLFRFLDLNEDGFIDLSEMVRGVALLCRDSFNNRLKVCFELFDKDRDGMWNEQESRQALEVMCRVYQENNTEGDNDANERDNPSEERPQPSCDVDSVLDQFKDHIEDGRGIEFETFVNWCESPTGRGLVNTLLQVIIEVCHVKMGLRPTSVEEESSIIRGYMGRFKKFGRKKGSIVNLVCSPWFNSWRLLTKFEMKECPLSSIQPSPVSTEYPSQTSKPKGRTNALQDFEQKMKGPIGEVVDTELPEVIEVAEEGDEGYTHIVTDSSSNAPIEGHTPSTTVAPAANHVTIGNGGRTIGGALKEQRGLGPIDNTSLCLLDNGTGTKKLISLTNEGGYLKKGLQEFTDFYVLPNEVWKALVTWYGTTGFSTVSTLPRTVVDDDGGIELYPVMFKVYKHTTLPPSKAAKSGPWTSFLEIIGYIRSAPEAGGVSGPPLPGDSAQPVLPRRILYYTACFDKHTTIQQMCESMQQVLHIKPEDLRIYKMHNEESLELMDEDEKTIEELEFRDEQMILIETRSKDNTWPEELMAVVKDMEKQELDQEKQNEKSLLKAQGMRVACGATGLSNLGNTCFMNSALQCLSNVQPLKIYFTEKDHLKEVNKANPLGTKGVLAKRYGELVQDLWSGHNKSVTPLKFRFTIARHAPQFNNFQQQDAQELLSFVLDGIHEDLNRVKEKPYRELADSDDRPDEEVAEEAWTYHCERNDSIIVDLLQGQLKSVVECSQCQYKSVKFDPFTFLSLPLPMEQKVHLEVIVVRLDGSQPIKYGLKQELEGKYSVVKEFLTEKTSIPYFMLVDVFGGTVRSFPLDHQKMRSVGLSGWLYAYEIPPAPLLSPHSPHTSHTVLFNAARSNKSSGKDGTSDKQPTEPIPSEGVDSDDTATQDVDKNEEQLDSSKEATKNEETKPSEDSANDQIREDVVENEEDSQLKEEEDTEGKLEGDKDQVVEIDTAISDRNTDDQLDPDEETNRQSGAMRKMSEEAKKAAESPRKTFCSPSVHGFLFAVNRKMLRVENYFISSQKNRPILFSVPMVVPCIPSTPRADIYATIWKQVQRLMIRDPPNSDNDYLKFTEDSAYPFVVKMVRRDGLFCCKCPWFRFCRGCVIPCNSDPVGTDDPHYLAIDWNDSFLHLKYQGVLERPLEDKSMEDLKTQDTKPIDLSDCFEAFSQHEKLGEDEYWYCKKCQDHRPAQKTLSIWRLPPILIVHLKRFQFHNGRWVKSQKVVNFPINGLEPKAYDGVKNEPRPLEEMERQVSVTPPIHEENQVKPLEVSSDETEEQTELNEERSNEDHNEEQPGNDQDTNEDHDSEQPSEGHSEEQTNKGQHEDQEPSEDHDNEQEPREEEQPSEGESVRLEDNAADSTNVIEHETEDEGVQDNDVLLSDDEVLDVPKRNDIYDLFAVTCHSGVLGGGHYTSFAKNPNNKWYYYNDSSCKETSDSKIQNESAYMLFYELRGLNIQYDQYRAASHRESGGGAPMHPSVSPADDEDRDYRESLRPSQTQPKGGRGSGGCRTQ